MIRTFVAGLFFWFAILGFSSFSCLLCGLFVAGLLWWLVPPRVPCGEEIALAVRLPATLPEAYRQGLLLLLGPVYAERTRVTQLPLPGRWEIFTECFFVTLTPENIVLRPGPKHSLVVHDMEATE